MLRHFHDLMAINTLDKDEECPVCLDAMILKKCSRYECRLYCLISAPEIIQKASLPCQHLICNTCLPGICKVDWSIRSTDSEAEQGEEVTKCPQCREQTPRTEVQLVHYTATQQWDELLDIAQQWAKTDLRRADETSEEEDEEEFIDDNTRYILPIQRNFGSAD